MREVNAARTARTLSSLLASGVDVLTALSITGEVVQNSYFRSVIAEAGRGRAAEISPGDRRHDFDVRGRHRSRGSITTSK